MKATMPVDEHMPDEIDFAGGERGRYAGRVPRDAAIAFLEPDVAVIFPDSDAVNAALRMVMRAGILSAGRELLTDQ